MSLFDDIVTRAAEPGDSFVPSRLLKRLEASADPLRLLDDWDQVNALSKELDDEFKFIRIFRIAGAKKLPTIEETNRWSSLVRWLIQHLSVWTKQSDPKGTILATIFIVATICDIGDQLWALLPRSCFRNAELERTATAIVKSIEIKLDSSPLSRHPISTAEFKENFEKAIAEQDWREIAESLHGIEDNFGPTSTQKQASRLLLQFGETNLANALSDVAHPVLAKMFIMALSQREAYVVASMSGNPFIQFAALREWTRRRNGDSTQFLAELTTLLRQICRDTKRWAGFMAEFNRYPVRYPQLQRSLGATLSTAPKEILEAYLSPIILHGVQGTDEGRACVCACLEVFRAQASLEQRRIFWALAHKRWAEWGFVEHDPDEYMFISHSILDYAIIGYALECLDSTERLAEEERLVGLLSTIGFGWKRSQTHMTAAVNRILSVAQPFLHASRMGLETSWRFVDILAPSFTQTEYYKNRYQVI